MREPDQAGRIQSGNYIKNNMRVEAINFPCHTCKYHSGGWKCCKCEVTLPTFHEIRCNEDQHEIHCTFYKTK